MAAELSLTEGVTAGDAAWGRVKFALGYTEVHTRPYLLPVRYVMRTRRVPYRGAGGWGV